MFYRRKVVREIIKENNFQTPHEECFKDVLQEMLGVEIEVHLGYSKGEKPPANTGNTRNGYSSKTVRNELGPIELDIPRDRKGEYTPKIVPKYSRDISGIEDKIISLYANQQNSGLGYLTTF